MRLSWQAARLHMHAPANLTRRFKRRHQGGDKRGAAQQTSAQRTPAGSRASLGALGRLAQAIWQRMLSRPRLGGGARGLVPTMPLLWSPPILRIISLMALRRAAETRPCAGPRPYLLRAHAQSRWRLAAGWA